MMVILSRTLDTIYAIGRFDDKRLPIKNELHNSCIRIDILPLSQIFNWTSLDLFKKIIITYIVSALLSSVSAIHLKNQ